jgi:hypothetical protein
MVGIHRKVVDLTKLLQKYRPVIDQIVPGLGTLVGSVAEIGESVADGVNSVYKDYNREKRKGKNYNFADGVDSFFKNSAPQPGALPQSIPLPSPIKSLTKSYGGLHPRLKLKENSEQNEF